MSSGRIRIPFHVDAHACRSYMKIRGVTFDMHGLRKLDDMIQEYRAQKECGYWTDKWDLYEINDGLNKANMARDYLDYYLNKDFSHYDEFGRTVDDEKLQDPSSFD